MVHHLHRKKKKKRTSITEIRAKGSLKVCHGSHIFIYFFNMHSDTLEQNTNTGGHAHIPPSLSRSVFKGGPLKWQASRGRTTCALFSDYFMHYSSSKKSNPCQEELHEKIQVKANHYSGVWEHRR